MDYILVIISGMLLGSIVFFYAYPKESSMFWFEWLANLYKKAEFIILEAVMVIIQLLLYRSYGITLQFASYTVLCAFLTAAALVDYKKKIIPNKLVIAAGAAGVVSAFANPDVTLLQSVIGGAIAGGALWFVSFVSKGALGMGDVKLFACMGLFLGVNRVLSSMVISTILSGIAGIILIIISTSNRKKEMPFAPFILAGCVLTLVFF